ncbi:class I histocompatibility antigen, F10 alpha chain-like [Sinocyclocheilus grahami]|uniref:Class I histocompatibility antigen, F10 alpha chain-like n=1 Tax=Sinocyclocheilus grahami TaxID=75366 RepID=A0A672L2V3_SINGR|nr:PREDICTED: class I histocompatibility antigen, F10 alpha chain-like [Sinocyclocheilus grahami]
MIFIIFFIYVPFVHSELHTLKSTYTGKRGQTTAVTTLDGQQIDYYDSVIKKLIPKQDWMKEFASTKTWKEYTKFRERVQQTNKINITALMQRFNQTPGVHVYQRMYGCDWNDETGESRGFDEYSYDGQRFISLDLKELRYTASVPEAIPTVQKWNKDRELLDSQCAYWLRKLLKFSKATFKKTGIVPKLAGQSLTEPTQKTENDTKTDGSASYASYIMPTVVIISLVILISIVLYALWNKWNHLKLYYNKIKYYRDVHSEAHNPVPEPPD